MAGGFFWSAAQQPPGPVDKWSCHLFVVIYPATVAHGPPSGQSGGFLSPGVWVGQALTGMPGDVGLDGFLATTGG